MVVGPHEELHGTAVVDAGGSNDVNVSGIVQGERVAQPRQGLRCRLEGVDLPTSSGKPERVRPNVCADVASN